MFGILDISTRRLNFVGVVGVLVGVVYALVLEQLDGILFELATKEMKAVLDTIVRSAGKPFPHQSPFVTIQSIRVKQ